MELVRVRKPEIDRLHAAHREAAEGTVFGIGTDGVTLFYKGDQVIDQNVPEAAPVGVIIPCKYNDKRVDRSLGNEIVELDMGIQVIVMPASLTPARSMQQIHGGI